MSGGFQFQVANQLRCNLSQLKFTSASASGKLRAFLGGVAERFKALVLKTSDGASHP